MAPAENPEIVVVVLNEHAGHGGAVAAPVAMAVIQGYFDLKAREADQKQILSEQEILDLHPSPKYAGALLAAREKHEVGALPASNAPVKPGATEEPQAPSDEVADPTKLVPLAPPETPSPPVVRPVPE
jgi:hypothetical protein